jgi:hypothetical protein
VSNNIGSHDPKSAGQPNPPWARIVDDDEGPWHCANGCGYEVAYHNDICAECAGEDDGDLY